MKNKNLLLISISSIFLVLSLFLANILPNLIYLSIINCIAGWQTGSWIYKLHKYLIDKFNL